MEIKKSMWKRKCQCGSNYAITTLCRTQYIGLVVGLAVEATYPLNITGCLGVGVLDLLTEAAETCMIFLRELLTETTVGMTYVVMISFMTELESVARTSPLVKKIVKGEREVSGVEVAVIDSDIGYDLHTVVSANEGIVIISDVRRVSLTQKETEEMFHLKKSPQKQHCSIVPNW